MKQWWTAVFLSFPAELVCGVADGCVQGCCMSTARLRVSNHSAFCFLPLASSHLYDPQLGMEHNVVSNLVFNVFFQCDRPCQLPLTRLSWIPNVLDSACLVAPPSFIPHHSPRSSIVDEFNKILCYIYIVCPTL